MWNTQNPKNTHCFEYPYQWRIELNTKPAIVQGARRANIYLRHHTDQMIDDMRRVMEAKTGEPISRSAAIAFSVGVVHAVFADTKLVEASRESLDDVDAVNRLPDA